MLISGIPQLLSKNRVASMKKFIMTSKGLYNLMMKRSKSLKHADVHI